jgi:hypothetical protein
MSIQQPYPRQPHEGIPEPSRPIRTLRAALALGGILLGLAAVMATGVGLLWAANPMGDEWVCSDGEAPAGQPGRYNQCFDEDAQLPPGFDWDPFGNRPMSYNCDKDGWLLIERPVRGGADTEQDCAREGTELPGLWHPAEDD